METTILIADDHPMVRTGVRAAFESQSEFRVIGEAQCGSETVDYVREKGPDILILDLKMPGDTAPVIIQKYRKMHPELKVVILSSHTDSHYLDPLRRSRLDGFVLKNEAPDCLLQAVRVVQAGENWFSHEVIKQLKSVSDTERPRLTPRDSQIYELMRLAKDNCTIASELNLSKQTVRRYATIIYEKLGVKNRIQAIVS